jgi:hypothetical protein
MRGLLPPPRCHIFSRDPADERATIAATTTRLAHLPAWQRTSPMSRTTLEEHQDVPCVEELTERLSEDPATVLVAAFAPERQGCG